MFKKLSPIFNIVIFIILFTKFDFMSSKMQDELDKLRKDGGYTYEDEVRNII